MEHSSENLDFHESVRHFHYEFDKHKENAQKRIAKKIYCLYVKLDAPLSVNLPSKMRNQMDPFFSKEAKHADIPKNVFDLARKEIYNVMNRDSFARFKNNGLWTEYLAHPDRHPEGAPKPVISRLASSVTGRRNSASLMQFVGAETLDEVLNNAAGRLAFKKFLEIDGGHNHLDLVVKIMAWQKITKDLQEPGKKVYLNSIDTANEIVQQLVDCDDLIAGCKQKLDGIKFCINDNSDKKNESELIPGALGAILEGFNPIVSDLKMFLKEENFHTFCNSALYIKYRMTVAKTTHNVTSAYGLMTETVSENPISNPNRKRLSSDLDQLGGGAGEEKKGNEDKERSEG